MASGGFPIVLALEPRTTMALTIFGVLLLLGGLLYLSARGELKGRRTARVPAAMRPAPPDEELERRVLERYLSIGAIATLAMAIWIPVYWLREPARLEKKGAAFLEQDITEGGELYAALCASCHGEDAKGAPRQVAVNGEQLNVAEPPLAYAYARYRAAGRSDDDIRQLLYQAIAQGRPGTVMPTWLLAYGGSLNSAQVESLLRYLESIQEEFPEASTSATGEELFEANCAQCHGVGGTGEGGVGPNLRVALQRHSVDEIRDIIESGRINWNRYSMPPWAALGEDAVDRLVRYVLSIQEG